MAETRLHTCMLCEAVCGIEVDVEGGRAVGVRGDRQDPFSRGHICPKAAAIPDVSNDGDRIREPMRRTRGGGWEPVSWDAALNEAAERLAALQKEHGRSSVALYFGNPTVHSYSALLGSILVNKSLGTKARFTATSVDQLPQMLAALQVFGHQLLLPVPDLERTQYLLILGGNPLVSNGSIMTAPDMKKRLAAIQKRGGKVVVVDPRRTETAAAADEHLFIKPGGDAALLLGMLFTIFEEKREKLGRLSPFTVGLDGLREAVRAFPPERVAARAGVPADTIRRLAREVASAHGAACYGRVGMCTQAYGGLASWLLLALNIVTGNLDNPGGMMFTTPAADLVSLARYTGETGHFGVWKSRVRGLPEFGGDLPCAVMAEEIETEGKGQIRGLITYAGNPVLSTPNGGRLDRALAKLDFMVSVDIYRNETTRHAHLILPTSFGLERDHYDLALYALAVRNVARYAKPVIPAPPGVRDDFDVLTDLTARVLRAGGGKPKKSLLWTLHAARALGPRRILDVLLRTGPHGVFRGGRLSLAALEKEPHGIDLGPLEPRLPAMLSTKDHTIRLCPPLFLADLTRLGAEIDGAQKTNGNGHDGLLLFGRRQLRSNNSWMHNSHRLVKGREGCTLLMHPEDASARGLSDGTVVRVASRVGAVTVRLELTADVARGTVSLPHGWGHARPGVQLSTAAAHAGASVNDLTDEAFLDGLSGNAAFSGVPVDVRPAAEA